MLSSNNDLEQQIIKCARCGYCREDNYEICPVRSILGFESSYARGKLNIANLLLIDNKLSINRDNIKIFYLCALCGNCMEHCPLKINIPKIVNEIRYRFLKIYDPFYDPNNIRNIVINFCHKNIIKSIISKMGRIGPRIFLLNKNRNSFLFFIGCMSEFHGKSLEKIFKIFNNLGINITELKEDIKCCGFPFYELGHRDILFSAYNANMNIFNKLGYKKIITNCPGCLYVFREMKNRMKNSNNSDIEFVHLTEFLNDNLVLIKSHEMVVTYHDPCLLGRFLDIYDAPRQLLSKIGITVKEMLRTKKNSFCCGGTLSITFPDLSENVSRLRVVEAKMTGSSILLTSCPLCKWNLSRINDCGMEILDIIDFIDKYIDLDSI